MTHLVLLGIKNLVLLVLKNCRDLVRNVAISDITSLFSKKICKKVFGVWGDRPANKMAA